MTTLSETICAANAFPAGACCLDDGSCQEVLEAECIELSGTYHGDDTSCFPADGIVADSPDLPPDSNPPDCDVVRSMYAGQGVHVLFPSGIDMSDPIHKCFTNVVRNDDGSGNEIETFDSVLTAFANDGSGPVPVTLTGPVSTIVLGKTGTTTGTWDTEMLSMSLSGDIGGIPIEIRESPSLPSTGQTTITDLGGGLYQIDSFFDVFTELSVDGGPFQPQTSPAGRMTLTRVICTPPLGPSCWDCLTQCHGDSDCDGDVDTVDWPVFRDAFGYAYPAAQYNPCGDMDHDGDVDTVDWPEFRDNFGYPATPDCTPGGTWPPGP